MALTHLPNSSMITCTQHVTQRSHSAGQRARLLAIHHAVWAARVRLQLSVLAHAAAAVSEHGYKVMMLHVISLHMRARAASVSCSMRPCKRQLWQRCTGFLSLAAS